MIRLAAHIPNPHDATNWYRGTGPLAALRKVFNSTLDVELMREWSFSSVQMKDIAFFQRPSSPAELEAIKICKRLNVPVIVDYDDLLFDLPTDNPTYRMYMNKKTQETIISIIREADCVWVSTKELKRIFQLDGSSLNERVYVVPNALDDIHLVFGNRMQPPPVKRRQPTIMWRGSQTHERDLMDYTLEIAETAEENEKAIFTFVGYNPWFLTDRMRAQQAILPGSMPIGEFMDFIYCSAPQLGIVPLHDSRFNRCKSNIAWLEMTWGGAVVLAPNWEEWQHKGVITYNDQADFKVKLKMLLNKKPHDLDQYNRASWKVIQENFMLSKVNHIRAETINMLVNKKQKQEWLDGWQTIADPGDVELE